MSDTQSTDATSTTGNRLQILKNGFKTYISSFKLPMSAETKWMLEIVCLNENPESTLESADTPVTQQAKTYIQGYLWNLQSSINTNKQSWINAMKNN